MNGPNAVRALFFGDFLLGQQKKVTRPPGGTGALARRALARRQGEPASPHQRCLNTAGRLARNAAMPSFWSSVENIAWNMRRSYITPSSSPLS